MLTRIDHIGIACRDLNAALAFYEHAYGLRPVHVETNDEQGVREAMIKVGETYLQLLEPIREDSPVGRFLARDGEGLHHIAFATGNVRTEAQTAREAGIRVLYDKPRRGTMGSLITFLHPKDCGGVLTELVERDDAGTHRPSA